MGNTTNRDEQAEAGGQGHTSIPRAMTRQEIESDLALLFTSEVFIGSTPLRQAKKEKPLYLRYESDGRFEDRVYLTPTSWRAKMMFDIADGKSIRVVEMDRLHRYGRVFPKTLLGRLRWHARANANFPPVARLYDPNGTAELLLTRSRLCGHGVDTLHNLAGAPMFQPMWVSDIMGLRPMIGMELERDETFTATLPISHYIEAAATTGRIVKEPELFNLPLIGKVSPLSTPRRPDYSMRLFDQLCKAHPELAEKLGSTIYADYAFG